MIPIFQRWAKPAAQRSSIADGLADTPTRNDSLGFQRLAGSIAKRIVDLRNAETPLTIGVYGAWGSGKTSFLSMVSEHLEKNGVFPVWFNAWRYDREDNLWAALLQTILNKAVVSGNLSRRLAARFHIWWDSLDIWRGTLTNVKVIVPISRVIFVLVLITFAVFWQKPVQSAIEKLPEEVRFSPLWAQLFLGLFAFIAAKPDQLIKLIFDTKLGLDLGSFRRERTFHDHIAFLDQFQSEFQRIIEIITPNRPLVIIIDDLDRCLPEKAIAILEAIKQFIDVTGCVFVVAVDHQIIERAVQIKYKDILVNDDSQERNASRNGMTVGYIEKIIQLPLLLPQVSSDRAKEFVEGLFVDNKLKTCALIFLSGMQFNPRKIKRVVRVFVFLHDLFQHDPEVPQLDHHLLAKLVLIQHEFRTVYDEIIRRPQLLPILEQHSRGATEIGHDVDPVVTEIASNYLETFAELRAVLALQVGGDDSFVRAEVSHYLYFVTAVGKSENAAGTPASQIEESPRNYLARLSRDARSLYPEIFIEPVIRRIERGGTDNDRTSMHLRDAIRQSTRLLIIGSAGSGKSTLLSWIAKGCLRGFLENDFSSQAVQLGVTEPLIPFIINCRDLQTNPKKDILGACKELLDEAGESNSSEVLPALFSSGRAFLLIDAMDELTRSGAREVGDDLARLCSLFPALRSIVTSRTNDVIEALPRFASFEIQPLNDAQVQEYFDLWGQSHRVSDAVIERLKRTVPTLFLSGNASPQLLGWTLKLFGSSQAAPRSRTEVTRLWIEDAIEREHLRRPSWQDTSKRVIEDALSQLAWRLQTSGRITMTDHEIREEMQRAGALAANLENDFVRGYPFLVQQTPGRYSFPHKTIQEYFAAVALLHNNSDIGELIEMNEMLRQEGWREVLLYVAELAPSYGVQIVRIAIERANGDTGIILFAGEVALSAEIGDQHLISRLRSIFHEMILNPSEQEYVKAKAQRILELIDSTTSKNEPGGTS